MANLWHWYARAPIAAGLVWDHHPLAVGLAGPDYRPAAEHLTVNEIGEHSLDVSTPLEGRSISFTDREQTFHASDIRFERVTGRVRVPFVHWQGRLVAYLVLDGVQEAYEGSFSIGVPSEGLLKLQLDMETRS